MKYTIDFPEDLPVSQRKDELIRHIQENQVVIVCGETGSGKTTQLPKMALFLKQQKEFNNKLIGHTQPRRLAATSVAARIADELKTPLGEVAGYKVRFNDRLSKGAVIKLMTDGILLAEIQSDALLRQYDYLIIDEAHERSLNIDFILGHLKQILPKRPDLKIIVTSATIDADKFANHFEIKGKKAPILNISGRTYPVEQRWRPFEEKNDYGINNAISDAVDELWTGAPSGDILIFLSGEREIREAADHLRDYLSHSPIMRGVEVLPLFARLSQAEQNKVFAPHNNARIVLATNVAETSLTVPSIKYVIDTGLARVKRYSYRSKVEQLLIEPISRAAANQRAGRCGRVANGICIRLYDETDFAKRDAFTDPEMLRSSLASVILRMKSLKLGAAGQSVENFPFLDMPSNRALTDGFMLLSELGAVDEYQNLTPLGAELAKLPLDPRVGRMILAAREHDALHEILIIASALSVQDVRDRPIEKQSQADAAHKKFEDEKSEFSGYVKLWNWLIDARGGKITLTAPPAKKPIIKPPRNLNTRNLNALPAAKRAELAMQAANQALNAALDIAEQANTPATQSTHKLSNRQWENLLLQNYINIRRVREWRDVYTQLHTVAAEHKWRENTKPASYEAVHKSLLSGLLGNIGCKIEEPATKTGAKIGDYLGARQIKFSPHPSAHINKKPTRWIMCAELVETSRLFGRGIASIEPQWIEEIGEHLIKRQFAEPIWDKKLQDVIVHERGTIYGLNLYSGRRKSLGKYDPIGAHAVFVRQALAENLHEDTFLPQTQSQLAFLAANARTVKKVQEIEHKSRRQDVLVDDELIVAFYQANVPTDISNATALIKWYKKSAEENPQILQIDRQSLMRHEAAGITTTSFPKLVRLGGIDCAAQYLHEIGNPRDGLTVTVPLFALNQIDEKQCEWLVSGMLAEKIQALLKSLPQRPRSRFVPLPANAQRLANELSRDKNEGLNQGLIESLITKARQETGLEIKPTDFKPDMIGKHLFMNIRVIDENGRQLGMSRNLAQLKAELGGKARGAFSALAALKMPEIAEKPAEKTNIDLKAKNTKSPQKDNVQNAEITYTKWEFGQLPEIMEIKQRGQILIGYPALIDVKDGVKIEVFDEPNQALTKHTAGLIRLISLNIKDTIKYLEKNIPDMQKMAVAFMPIGTETELKAQIINLAISRAFLSAPLPINKEEFEKRLTEGKARLTLIAQEVAKLAGIILQEYQSAARKIKDTKNVPEVTKDATEQLQRLVNKDFLIKTNWQYLQYLPRYLKAIYLRMDKLRQDMSRDAQNMAQVKAQEQRLFKKLAERKGQADERLENLRWLIEELRVSLFAQELKTPQPVSIKRLEKVWAQIE